MNAKKLIEEIKAEKNAAVRSGILREEKALDLIRETEIPRQLPEGWEWCRLGDYAMKVTDYVASGSFASLKENVLITNDENYAVMVKTADFANGFTKNLTYTDEHGYKFLENSNLFGGELILSNIGSIGKVFIVPDLNRPMTLASNTVMVRMTHNEYNKYMYYMFKSSFGQNLLMSISSGTSMLKFNKTQLKSTVIPIAPLEEQDKICKVLDKVQNLIDRRQQQLAKLDKLIKARFVELFGDPESAEKYPQIAIKDFTDVISGGTPDRKNNQYWENGTVPWVKTTELQNKRINSVEECITEKGLNESSAKVVPENTVLIAMYGQGKTRGMTAILGIPASTNQACACILPCETVEPKYLWQYMIMSYDRLRNLAQGGNQPNLNGNMIKNFTVLVPPVELQMQFVKFVEQVDKSKVVVQKSLEETQKLFDSLMQEYFG